MALIEVLGCAEADHNQEGRKADRTTEWAAMPGKQGKCFFFFFLFPHPDISINNVFQSRIFVLWYCWRTVGFWRGFFFGAHEVEVNGRH